MHEPNRLPLSVVMIARNEAHRIRRSLGSIADLAEEIVVVHNDCSDDTERIAREEFGARTYEHPWHGQRDQKQIAIDYATHPWVLLLDADEEFSEPLRRSLVEFVSADAPGVSGAYFARCRQKDPAASARDPETARRLWDASARLTGIGAR